MAKTKKEASVNNRAFKGIWIPKEVYLNHELTWTEKILLIEIESLDGEDHCFATNGYFGKFLSCDPMYVSQCISKLVGMGLIESTQENGRRIIRSNLKKLYTEALAPVEPVKGKAKREKIEYPTILECVDYFVLNGYPDTLGQKFFNYYHQADWKDGKGNKVLSWKQKAQGVWFKDENKVTLQGKQASDKILNLDLKLFK